MEQKYTAKLFSLTNLNITTVMEKSLKINKSNSFEEDYSKIMSIPNSHVFLNQVQKLNNPKDYITKFSLIKEVSNSITTNHITTSLISK
jgi:hypothetical protein